MESALISNLVLQKNFQKLKLYIELGFEVSLTQQNGDSVEKFGTADHHVFNLVINDSLKSIKRLRAQSLNVVNGKGYSPLHWAIISHRNDIFDYLLDMGCGVSAITATGENCFTLAARYNNTHAFKRLLQKYGTRYLLHTNERGFNALIFAAANKNREIMQYCLESAPLYYIRANNNYGANFLHWFFHGQTFPDCEKKMMISTVLKYFLTHLSKHQLQAILNERNGIDYTPINWLEYYKCTNTLDLITRI